MSKFTHYHQPWIDEDEMTRGHKVKAPCGVWVDYDLTGCLAVDCPECLKHGFILRWGASDETSGFDCRPLREIEKHGAFNKQMAVVRCLGDWDGWKKNSLCVSSI